MATPQNQYGYQPTLKDKISSALSRHAPAIIAKVIQSLTYAFVAVWRFVGQLLRDALGR